MHTRDQLAFQLPMTELPEQIWLVIAKGVGAVLGSAVSLAYILPRGRREAAIRFGTGVSIGVLFGPAVGAWLVAYFELASHLTRFEVVMTGSAASSLCAWWALGLLQRLFAGKPPSPKP